MFRLQTQTTKERNYLKNLTKEKEQLISVDFSGFSDSAYDQSEFVSLFKSRNNLG